MYNIIIIIIIIKHLAYFIELRRLIKETFKLKLCIKCQTYITLWRIDDSLPHNVLELCADELVVGGGVGWSYDRRRRRAAHFSSAAAAWLYGRRRRRQTG